MLCLKLLGARSFSRKQRVYIAEGLSGMSSEILYFSHGYKSKNMALSSIDTAFGGDVSPSTFGNWSEIYVSATLSDYCSGDAWSKNPENHYCVGDDLSGGGGGDVNCCTNKYGKHMAVGVCVLLSSGAE